MDAATIDVKIPLDYFSQIGWSDVEDAPTVYLGNTRFIIEDSLDVRALALALFPEDGGWMGRAEEPPAHKLTLTTSWSGKYHEWFCWCGRESRHGTYTTEHAARQGYLAHVRRAERKARDLKFANQERAEREGGA